MNGETRWDETCDVVVLGAGAGGMTAALVSSLEGRHTLLLEKSEQIGGTTARSSGTVWIPNNPHQRRLDPTDDSAVARSYLDALVGDRADRSLRDAFVDAGPAMIEYLEARADVRFQAYASSPDYRQDLPGAANGGRPLEPLPFDGRTLGKEFDRVAWPLRELMLFGGMMVTRGEAVRLLRIARSLDAFLLGARLVTRYVADRLRYKRGTRLVLGNALAARLYRNLLDRQVPIWFGAQTQHLVLEDGELRGLVVKTPDGERRVRATCGVVLAGGGFPASATMRRQYLPQPVAEYTAAYESCVGETLSLAQEVGAAIGPPGEDNALWFPSSIATRADGTTAVYPHIALDRSKPGLVAVNAAGRRFVDEASSYHEFTRAMYRSHRTVPSIPAVLVCDRRFVWKYGLGMIRPLTPSLQAYLDQGYLHAGETIEDLARKVGVDPAGLAQTINAANEYARTGVDTEFGKGGNSYDRFNGDASHAPNPCLGPIDKAPFYAVKVLPHAVGHEPRRAHRCRGPGARCCRRTPHPGSLCLRERHAVDHGRRVSRTGRADRHRDDVRLPGGEARNEPECVRGELVGVDARPGPGTTKSMSSRAAPDLSTLLDQGIALHQAGRLEEAARIYTAVLGRDPGQIEALRLLGTVEMQRGNGGEAVRLFDATLQRNPRQPDAWNNRGIALKDMARYDESIASFDRALALRPDYAEAHCNRGNALHAQGRHADAIASFDRAVAARPRYARALGNRGNALADLGRFAEAIASYDQALAVNPDDPELHCNRGIAASGLGRHEEALASFDRALAVAPDYAEAHSNRGNALVDLGRHAEAVASFDRALALRADYAEAWSNRGVALRDLKRCDEAIASLDRAVALKPDLAEAWSNRGAALRDARRYAEAVASCDRAIALKPDHAEAWCNRGNALNDMRRHDEAIASYDRAIASRRGYADALSNRGNALVDLGRHAEALASFDEAIHQEHGYADAFSNRGNALADLGRDAEALASYDEAIALDPEHGDAHWNKGLLLLRLGRFDEGWKLYEWRWKRSDLPHPPRRFRQPLWLGEESLAGKTILLHAEQGLGDTIQFCRYVPLLAERGARIVLEAPAPLEGLLATLAGPFELVREGGALPEFDYQCPLPSLPRAFRTTLDTVPAAIPYLAVDPQRRTQWQARLGERTRPRIGLAWSGRPTHRNDRNRSVEPDTLTPILGLDAEFHCLQKDIRPTDRQTLAAFPHLRLHDAELRDFTDTAALVDAMDIVLSVDTSVAHLAGALGRPTWIMLPFAPDFRWLTAREDSPWYPTVRLFRQPRPGDWASVVAAVVARVAEL